MTAAGLLLQLQAIREGHKALPLDPPAESRRPQEYHHHGTVQVPGLPTVDVETPEGTVRQGRGQDGSPWAVLMPAHYGEFRGTLGVDGDAVDVFVGPERDAPTAWVIRAKDPKTGRYDEDKVMVGFATRREALRTFRASYDVRGVQGEVTGIPVARLGALLADAKQRGRPLNLHEAQSAEPPPVDRDSSLDDAWRRLEYVRRQIAELADTQEGGKAIDRRDTNTMSMFDLMGDPSHGGRLHKETRTDATGRSEARWITAESSSTGTAPQAKIDPKTAPNFSTAPSIKPPPEALVQIGERAPRARGAAPTAPGLRAQNRLDGLGHDPSPAPAHPEPSLRDYDTILVNSSAGKDSQAMLDYVVAQARAQGVLDRVVVVHADLGRVEWEGTRELAEAQARHYGLRFEVVQKTKGDLIEQIDQRAVDLQQRSHDVATLAKSGVRTWGDLAGASAETLAGLIGPAQADGAQAPDERARKLKQAAERKLKNGKAEADPVDFGKEIAWPSSASRYCTSDHKRGPIRTLMTRLTDEIGRKGAPVRILNCMGLRADESSNRAKMPVFERDDGASNGKRQVDEWLPIHHWTEGDVWRRIRDAGTPYHGAYDLGMRRLSCVFCVFATRDDLKIAAQANPALFREYVALERRVGHKFRADLALTELADALAADSPPEAGKAADQMRLFEPTHGGRLHAETRTDKRGRTERRWVTTTPAGPAATAQLALFNEAETFKIDLGGYFASGSNHAGEIAGFADIGINPGATASEMNREAETAAAALRGRTTPDGRLVRFFLDSGAFGEIAFTPDGPVDKDPITHAEWTRRLDLYDRMADALGGQLYAVAPDKVADQEETLRRLTRYADRVRAIRAKGAHILVPIQKGAVSMAAFAARVDAILGTDWTPAIPMKKDATSDADLAAFLRPRRPLALHLLGVGPRSTRFPDIERIVAETSPGARVTLDSVAITAAVGRPEKGPPRKLTAAQDKVREDVAESAFAATDPDLADYTDEIGFPGGWTSAAERRRIAAEMDLDKDATAAFVADPDGWLQQHTRGEDSPKNYEMPWAEVALDRAWHRFITGAGSTTVRKRRAIRIAFGEGAKAMQLSFLTDLDHGGRLHLETRTDRRGRTEHRHVRTKPLHAAMGHAGAPAPGERGHAEITPERAEAERRAANIVEHVGRIFDGGEVHLIEGALHDAGHAREWAPEESFEDDPMTIRADELPGLIGMPEWRPQDAADAVALVAESADRGGLIPAIIVREILADAIAPAGKLRLVNVPLDTARAFIAEHHSQMPEMNPRGLIYAVGCMRGGRLVAVATAGTPTGRWGNGRVDPRNILELTRIASDGTTKGASSKLAARMIDLLDRSKRGDAEAPALFVTYSLSTEDGTTYRALREKGLRPVARVEGKAAGGGGARSGNRLGYAEPDKIRWEAGAAAGPARWDLIEGAKAGPIANAPGLHLDPTSHRWTRDDQPAGHLFHTTSHASMPQIASKGLQPRSGEGLYGHGAYANHSQGKVFLSHHFQAAKEWHGKVGDQLEDQHGDGPLTKRVPVMLRATKRRTVVDPVGNEDVEGSRYTKQAIPPEDLEYWHPAKQAWRPVATWGDDTGHEHGVLRSENDADGYTLHFIRDQHDEGGFMPHTAAQANAEPSAETKAHRAGIEKARAEAESQAQQQAQERARQAEAERVQRAAEHQRKEAEAAAADAAWHQDPVKRRDTVAKFLQGAMKHPILTGRFFPAGRIPEHWQSKLKVDEHGNPHPGTDPLLPPDETGKAAHKDRLHGGPADEMEPEDFDPDDLAEGTEEETEHTDDRGIAQEIAMDHLAENPAHYREAAKGFRVAVGFGPGAQAAD